LNYDLVERLEKLQRSISEKRLDPANLDFVADWSIELKTMNERKEGARYRYPESFVKLLVVVHDYLLPYRQPEGFTRALNQYVGGLKAPDYTTIWWRTMANPYLEGMELLIKDGLYES